MDRLKEKMLAQVRSHAAGPAPVNWQQRKSAGTRGRILEATVDCLVEKGYSGLSTNEVTQRAKVSRGAMHHYFTTRMALVAAVIEHVFFRRLDHFLTDYFDAVRTRGGESVVAIAADIHWQSVQTRDYAAYVELAIAARTDEELNSHFAPAMQRYDQFWTDEMFRSFPEWEERWDSLRLANDFTIAAHMGLLLHRPVFGSGERMEAVCDLISKVIQSLHGDD